MKPLNYGRLTPWILAWLLALPALAAAAELPAATDFAADARTAGSAKIPILVFFSRVDCPWCEMARRDTLLPLAQEPANATRVLIREVVVRSDKPLVDFNGRVTTQRAFAKARRIRMVPTVEFLDARGKRLADPIVGVDGEFFSAIVGHGIIESSTKLRGSAGE